MHSHATGMATCRSAAHLSLNEHGCLVLFIAIRLGVARCPVLTMPRRGPFVQVHCLHGPGSTAMQPGGYPPALHSRTSRTLHPVLPCRGPNDHAADVIPLSLQCSLLEALLTLAPLGGSPDVSLLQALMVFTRRHSASCRAPCPDRMKCSPRLHPDIGSYFPSCGGT